MDNVLAPNPAVPTVVDKDKFVPVASVNRTAKPEEFYVMEIVADPERLA